MFFGDVDDADGHGAEHPFVGVGGHEVDVFHGSGEGADGLDGIEGEEDAAVVEHLADGVGVDAIAGEEVAGSEGDEAGALGDIFGDEFGGNGAGLIGAEVFDFDAV